MLAVLNPFNIASRRKVRARTPDPDGTVRGTRHRRNKSFSEIENLSTLLQHSQHTRRMSNGTAEIALDSAHTKAHSPSGEHKKFPGLSLSRFHVGGRHGDGKEKRRTKKNRSPQPDLQRVSQETLKQWSESFDAMLSDSLGLQLFEEFLRKEYSEENMLFWKACQKYKDPKQTPDDQLQTRAEALFAEFISPQAPNMVNIDHIVTEQIMSSIISARRTIFDSAEQSIYMLMYRDSFSRFIAQQEFKEALIR